MFLKLQKRDHLNKFIEVPVDRKGRVLVDRRGFVKFRHPNSAGNSINRDLLFEMYKTVR